MTRLLNDGISSYLNLTSICALEIGADDDVVGADDDVVGRDDELTGGIILFIISECVLSNNVLHLACISINWRRNSGFVTLGIVNDAKFMQLERFCGVSGNSSEDADADADADPDKSVAASGPNVGAAAHPLGNVAN